MAKPAGAVVTASPWLIQTFCLTGSPANNFALVVAVISVRPNSDFPVWLTTPPSAAAIA